jgi:hypothetical protein
MGALEIAGQESEDLSILPPPETRDHLVIAHGAETAEQLDPPQRIHGSPSIEGEQFQGESDRSVYWRRIK